MFFNFVFKTKNFLRFLLITILILYLNCVEFDFNSIKAIRIKEIGEIEKLLDETDMTYFAYYYKPNSENSKRAGEIIKNIANKLEYLASILLIDCDEENLKSVEMCKAIPEAQDGFPRMEIYSPPQYKYNPYTKEMLKHSKYLYNKQEVGENLIYNFITQHIPARVTKLDAANFENFATNLDLNKVILFTDKEKTPLLFRGLSNHFYDKLLFGEVGKDETALLKKFKVKIFPTLLVYQTHEDEIPLDEPEIEIFDKPINAASLVKFLEKFALPERISDRKKNTNDPNKLKYKIAFKNLKVDDVLSYLKKFNERRFVVYLDTNLDKERIPESLKKFNKLTSGFFHFVRVNCYESKESENFCKETFRVNEIPTLVLLNNENDLKEINKRIEKRIELSLDFNEIVNEINRIFPSDMKETNPQTFNIHMNEAGINKKLPFIFFYENDEIPLGLNLISSEKKFKKFAQFISYENPPKSLLQNLKFTNLPKLIMMIQDKDKPGEARVMLYDEELVYSRLYAFINQYFNIDRNSRVNQEEEIEEDVAFIEDKSKFDVNCVGGRKLCVMAFLDGRKRGDSQEQFRKHMNIFEHVNKDSLKKRIPASFAWVNATCQTEFASQFNVNSESLPGAVVYVPSKKLFTSLVGTFDEESLLSFLDRVLQGRVPFNKIDDTKFKFSDTPCENIKEVASDDSDDELLREIIEEEKRKREEFERERKRLDEDSNTKKKKKKKKKSDL